MHRVWRRDIVGLFSAEWTTSAGVSVPQICPSTIDYSLCMGLHSPEKILRAPMVASLLWPCQLGFAPAYLMDLCRPVPAMSGAGVSRSLRSAERGVLVVPFARTAAMQNRAFSVAGLRVWNDLPQELRLFPRLCTDTFLGRLKTYLFVHTGVGSASE